MKTILSVTLGFLAILCHAQNFLTAANCRFSGGNGSFADNQAVFTALGFEVEAVGSTTVMVSSLPASFGSCGNVERIFMDMLAELLENFGSRLPVALENVARAACKAAVKAHDVLSENELQILLRELRECRQGTLCPHGRPTMVSMSIKELEKRFFRR